MDNFVNLRLRDLELLVLKIKKEITVLNHNLLRKYLRVKEISFRKKLITIRKIHIIIGIIIKEVVMIELKRMKIYNLIEIL